jgi:carbohydrate kinase (thermoresistant glucokinase family)
MRCYVLMGVSGCGKTSVGERLAERRALTFIDGDALHPQANIDKMASGTPLDDADRAPWLARVGAALAETPGPVVIGCSALKRAYRDQIRAAAGAPVCFLHLAAPKEVLRARVADRPGHFMPAALLDSQFAALEALAPDETGQVIDIDQPFDKVVEDALPLIDAPATEHATK